MDQNEIEFKWLSNTDDDREKCFYLRKIVFCDEQKFSLNVEFDEYDSPENNTTLHVLLYVNKNPVGSARIYFFEKENKWCLSRICILKEFRRKKLGNCLMNELIKKCQEKKINEVFLSGLFTAKDFYIKNGFKEFGEKFFDYHLEYIWMKRII